MFKIFLGGLSFMKKVFFYSFLMCFVSLLSTKLLAQNLFFEYKGDGYEVASDDFSQGCCNIEEAEKQCAEGSFLPTMEQLVLIYNEFHLKGLGNFTDGLYLSSDRERNKFCLYDFRNGDEHCDWASHISSASFRCIKKL